MKKDLGAILGAMRPAALQKPAVEGNTPFQVLIATVLSQRTKDKNTEKAAKQLFEKYPDPESVSNAPLAKIESLVRPAGFYKVKASRVKETARVLIQRHGSKVPENLDELLSLPGVGRKTANCVLVYGFKKPAMPVDVHVHRISNRIGLVQTKNPEQTEAALKEIIPKRNWLELNHLMVRYGQAICLPRNPKCGECKIRGQCDYFKGKSTFK